MVYSSYSEIHTKWAEKIPATWEYIPLRHLFFERKEKNDPVICTEILSLTNTAGVIPYSQKGNMGNRRKDDLLTYHIAHAGDLVVNSMNVIIGSSGVSDYYGCVSPVYYALAPRNNVNSRYYGYLFRTPTFYQSLKPLGNGILEIRLRIPMYKLNTVLLPVPPRNEQDQIVRYLDWQISRINHLIHGYQKQIKLLEERKITLIDNAVTKGINPDAPMQTISGCWMGNIPAHWRMIPSKRVFVEGKERRREGDVSATASQKYGIISQEEYMRRENRRIVVANQGLDDWKHVEPGNFVISLRSFQGGIELCEITGCVTWHYIVLLPQEMVCPQYFKWLLKSKSYIKALQGTSEFIRDGQDLRYSNFVKVDLPLIPLDEQNAIAEYITAEVAKIDNALPIFQKEIELLREYRTRLISDVVTGQIDVRDVVIPEYTPEEDTEIDTDDAGEDMEEVAEDAE